MRAILLFFVLENNQRRTTPTEHTVYPKH